MVDSTSTSNSLFPFLPRWVKAVLFLVILANARSWPFVWHFKVWYSALKSHFLARIRGPIKHLRQLPCRGADPFQLVSKSRYFAGVDDIDWNGHLSNSCYAKNLDAARMKACVDMCSLLFVAGGWMALGGASYDFRKEIPAFANYEIEMTIGGFGDKWVYLVGTFLISPKDKKSSKSSSNGPSKVTVLPADLSAAGSGVLPAANGKSAPRADGKVVCCVSVSTYCFKIGRMTIPPAVALSFCGFSSASNWDRFERLHRQGPKAMRDWLKEGWKEEPEALMFDKEGRTLGQKGEEMRTSLGAFGQ